MTSWRWDGVRHWLVARSFGRLFATVNRSLCAPGQLPTKGIHRVLVCRPNHRLGNAILITPLLTEIEMLYPGAETDVVCGGGAALSLFTNRFQLRRVFSLPRKVARHPWATLKLLLHLRHERYDLAIDACDGSQSGRLLLALVHARFKLGFMQAGTAPTAAVDGTVGPQYFAERSVSLLRKAYAGQVDRPCSPLSLRLSTAERERGQAALAAVLGGTGESGTGCRVIGIFANATGPKCYSVDWWQQFVDTLRTLQSRIRIVDLVAEHGQSQLGGNFPSYYTRNLRHLAAVIAAMDGFISADCGVMHLAVASGTPTLGLFAVTSAQKYGPRGGADVALDTRTLDAAQVATLAAQWLDGVNKLR